MSLAHLRTKYRIDGRQRTPYLITEVTRMKGDRVCVACLDISTGRMVRPLTSGSQYWPSHLTAQTLRPGAIVRHKAFDLQRGRGFPHQTEDRQMDDEPSLVAHLEPAAFLDIMLSQR